MKPLNRLLIADAKRMWRQGLAISVLMGCGIATFVMSASTMRSLETSQQHYYADYRFADVFVQLTRAPLQLARRLAEIPGVEQVQARIVRSVILDIPGLEAPASCQLVSIGADPARDLNGMVLLKGRMPNPSGRVEVLASQPFANANGLRPGDSLDVIMGGRQERLLITGIAMSPEFVYAVQPGLLLTDDRRFGILWMPKRQMEAAFNMEGAFNDASLRLRRGASTADVLFEVDRLTRRYGGMGAYDRSDQPSHHRLADEMKQMKSMAFVTPSIFLAVSTFLFNIALSRMVHQQTEQIATLRAFGFRPREIGLHYLKFVALLVALGAVLGGVAGVRLSWWMTSVYVKFFQFPHIYHNLATRELALAVLIGLAAALAGSFSAIRRAMRLPPAVAMRPEAPPTHAMSITNRFGIGHFLSPISRMIVRRIETNRRTTFYSVLGMAMGGAVLVLGSFFENTIEYVTEAQFERSQRQDVMLTFHEQTSAHALYDAANLPGVLAAEPFRAVPARLRHGTREHRLSLMGLEESPELYRVLDTDERPIALPARAGLTISEKLAEVLDVRLGEEIFVEILEGQRETRRMIVSAVFPDYASPGAYINRGQLHRLMREGEQLSGAFLAVDTQRMSEFYAAVKQTPAIAGVLDKNAAKQNFEDTIAENTQVMRTVNAVFASIIAFGVIYNCAMITLAERSRDLATLRVLGFSRHEVSLILLGELAIITLLSLPLAMPIGYGFAWVATQALDTETHRFPLVVHRATFAHAAVTVTVAATISSLIVRTMLDKLNLIAVLKAKE
ncbi:MAG: FtsX-like permease family protein [Planctomycetales bacterium]|nr:FtsX-like permease family protein [Planctomycetales bacterium]